MSTDRGALEGLRIERQGETAPVSRRGRWIVAAVALLVLALALGGWLSRPAALPVRVAAVHEAGGAAAGAVLNASGYVTARRQATVSSKVTGKVVEVLIEEGMEVKEGQVLARLDDARPRTPRWRSPRRSSVRPSAPLDENEVRLRQAEHHAAAPAPAARRRRQQPERRRRRGRRRRLVRGAPRRSAGSRSRSPSAQVALRRQDVDDTVIRAPLRRRRRPPRTRSRAR